MLSFTQCGMFFLHYLVSVMYACHNAAQDTCLETYIARLGQIAENSLSDCSVTPAQGGDLYYLLGDDHGFSSSNYCFLGFGLFVCFVLWFGFGLCVGAQVCLVLELASLQNNLQGYFQIACLLSEGISYCRL